MGTVRNVGGATPPLKLLHSEEMIKANPYYDYWVRQSTADVIESLRPGAAEPLTVDEDGLVWQGNTRTYILRQRGYDVDSLPRTPKISAASRDDYDRD